MAAQSLLRRWKPFYGVFASVDAAIEAADPDLCRDEFRRTRGEIVEMLCDAADDHQAERLCGVLDDVMAEALETLRLVPAMAKMLASTDLAEAIGGLRKHDSERVRLLASGIMNAWKGSVQDDLAKARAAMEKLEPEMTTKRSTKIQESSAKKTSAVTDIGRAKASHTDARTKVTESTKLSPPGGILCSDRAVRPCSDDAKMASTKRKLREAYEEAEDAKHQRKIRVVEAPKTTEESRRKMHPVMRERSRARCGSSMVKRSFSVSRQA